MEADTSGETSRIIVSFTSYPARINFVPRVLESLYAQSKKPDMILLWLAEEQFPNREEDFPDELIDDKDAGRFELRWCDDLGSHKKYFYAMQEYPEDIIITCDDDMIYHRDTVKTLCELHNKYPMAVASIYAKLMLFDDKNNLRPYTDWLYNIVLPVPSMQIIPMGCGGVLYPPHVLDKDVFDKKTILGKLKYKGVVCDDDVWLKIHSLLAGVPSVTQADYLVSHQVIPTASNIGTLDTADQQQQNLLSDEFSSLKSADGKHSIQDIILNARKHGDYYDLNSAVVRERTYQFIIEKLNTRIQFAYGTQDGDGNHIRPEYLHYVLSFFTMAMTYGDADLTRKYTAKLKESFLGIPNIDELSRKSKFIDAFIKYDAVLLEDLNIWNKQLKNYYQMLSNWKKFLLLFPEASVPYTYMFSYMRFLRRMYVFSNNMSRSVYSSVQIAEMKKIIRTEWEQIPLALRFRFLAQISATKIKRGLQYRKRKK